MRILINNFISVALPMAVVYALHFFLNVKRTNRRRMVYQPVVALLCSLVFSIYVVRLYTDYGTSLVARLLQRLYPRGFGEVYFYCGIGIATVYLGLRLVYMIVSMFLFKTENIFTKPGSIFYVHDDEYDEWFLKPRYVLFRKIFLILSLIAALITVIYTTYIRYHGLGAAYALWYFPLLPSVVLIECFNFLNGYTRAEFLEKFGGDASRSARFTNFYKIREVLERTFAHEVLTSGTGCEFRSVQNIEDLLDSMEGSEDNIEQNVANFFRLNGNDNIYNADYIVAVSRMMHGSNVIFYDPFYRDLGKYVILPVIDVLLKGKNVLIVVSRRSTEDDIIDWMRELLYKYGRIRDLWRVEKLSSREADCEVGVISFSQLYDVSLVENNAAFLKNVGFVFFSEPSYILNTGQIGLNIIATQTEDIEGAPIYCVCDRICDGLVDSLSHVLRSEFAEVVAPPVARNVHTAIGWKADGDYLRQRLLGKQTKYLGNGLELAAVAIKNQIPEVYWFGERKAPVRDIRWIAGQYYQPICAYMNLPIQQESIYGKIKFISNIWCVPEKSEQFVIAEDEFMNLFSTMRTFLSRGREQTFINVLSENYLLRDYMRCNYQMFSTNPDAIPSIVPDYVKSPRNTLIKLLYNMAYRSVSEKELLHELHMADIETEDAFSTLSDLLSRFTGLGSDLFSIKAEKHDTNGVSFESRSTYRISKDKFDEAFLSTLRIAVYICEEDKEGEDYIDAKMFGHVTQSTLPGQYMCYDGKYYYVQSVSPSTGVILRRASNLYDGRKYYRQLREYQLSEWDKEDIISSRSIMDIGITHICGDITVITSGYLEMKDSGDFRNARLVDFSDDPRMSAYMRSFKKKNYIKINLPDASEKLRFSFCMLLSEVMRSVFPDGWQYLAVVTSIPDDIEGMLNYLLYRVSGCVDDECIYIIEDSEFDLGLLEAVEKNLLKLMEIVTDFLGWHFEKMREPTFVDPRIVTEEYPEEDEKRRKEFSAIALSANTVYGAKDEKSDLSPYKTDPDADVGDDESVEASPNEGSSEAEGSAEAEGSITEGFVLGEEETDEADGVGITELLHDSAEAVTHELTEEINDSSPKAPIIPEEDSFEPDPSEDPDIVAIDGTDIFDESGTEEDNEYLEERFKELGIVPRMKSRYQEECYLRFGFSDVDKRLCIDDVHKYLTVRGFGKNEFRQARAREELDDDKTLLEGDMECDFCGLHLSGVCFERLDDGRIRCSDCSASAVNTVEELKVLFKQCDNLMENFFGIRMVPQLRVRMADARKINRGFGRIFKPSKKSDARILGYAQRIGKRYTIYLENGSPRMATIMTLVHEMTHIWQYKNWKMKEIHKKYPTKQEQEIVLEGMAVWVSVQYLYLIGEDFYAHKQEKMFEAREDVYGEGFRRYSEKYPIIRDSSMVSYTPFAKFPPIELNGGE